MKNQRKAGTILQYGQMALSILIGVVYTPVMIRLLGQSEYGLYNTVSSMISMLSLLSLGFNSGYIRYYARYKKNNQQESIDKLNGMFLIIFLIIGFIALMCGLFLSCHLYMIFDKGLTASEYEIARILMILLSINLAIEFVMSVFSGIISAHEKFVFLKVLGMCKTVLSPLVTIPLLLAGYRSPAMVSVTVGITMVTDIAYLYYSFAKLNVRFVFKTPEKGLFKELSTYTVFIAINMVVDQINWNIDKMLLGRFKGTETVAVYSVGYSLYSYYQMFSTSVSGVFTPQIHKLVYETSDNKELQKKSLTELFIKVGRIQFWVLGLVATGLVFFGKQFIVRFWAGSEYENSYYVMLLLVFPATIPLIQNIGIEIQRALNLHHVRSVVYAVMAFFNLGISIVLCQKYGAIGSALGTAISLVIANGLIMNVYYHKKCNIDIIDFWRNVFGQMKGVILPILCGMLINICFELNSILVFGLGIIVFILVYIISIYFLGMNPYEKSLIKDILAIKRR